MTPTQLRKARIELGKRWAPGGRVLRAAELARLLGYEGRDPGLVVARWSASGSVPGVARVAIEMMLSGAEPPTLKDAIALR